LSRHPNRQGPPIIGAPVDLVCDACGARFKAPPRTTRSRRRRKCSDCRTARRKSPAELDEIARWKLEHRRTVSIDLHAHSLLERAAKALGLSKALATSAAIRYWCETVSDRAARKGGGA
jgi:hypothetical protein